MAKSAAMLAVLFAWLLGVGDVRAQGSPVPVDRWDLERQRLAGEERLRAPGAGPEADVSLEVIVDERGQVASVAIDPDVRGLSRRERGDRWLPLARRQLRDWRFRPWLRDGRPVPVRVAYSLQILPPERPVRRRIDFPRAAPAETEIVLERSQCFGSCPYYQVTVRGDGLVRYEGRSDVLVMGMHEYRIPAARAEALIEQFRAAGFWSFDRRYVADMTDSQSITLTVRAGRRSKQVVDYVGEEVGMPRAVARLQDAVDAAADSARFVTGNERTIEALEAAGFDFRSPEAASLFFLSISEAPEAVPVGFLDRGAPVTLACADRPANLPAAWPTCAGSTYERAALQAAAAAGRSALFDRLARDDMLAALERRELDRLLIWAARARSLPIVERLLARGARAQIVDPELGSALLQTLSNETGQQSASPEARREMVRLLIARGSDVAARDFTGRTALDLAAYEHPDIVRMLIEAGADVNAQGRYGRPLLYETEDEESALLALAAGADRTLRDESGRTLAERARRFGWTRVEATLAEAPR